MPYVAIGRIAKALKNLERFHAFFGTTFLSMKKSGVTTGSPITWGSGQENELLNSFYSPPGAPPGKPYFIPFGKDRQATSAEGSPLPGAGEREHGKWKNPKYSAGTLQRARTTDRYKDALRHPKKTDWAFEPNYLDVLEGELPKFNGKPVKIGALDLAAWLYRDQNLPDQLSDVVQKFRSEFNITDAEFQRLFSAATEPESQFYFDEPYDRDEFVDLVGGVPDGPALRGRSEADLVASLEEFVEQKRRLVLPSGFARSFYYALKTQRFVVLAGRPGTGKTAFAKAIADGLRDFFPNSVSQVIISIGPDFSEADVLGYEKIAGDLAATELTTALFLRERPKDLYFVILDEMNLAQVDHYLARLLPAIESDAPVELPGRAGARSLPPDSFFVGTINSFVEEPSRLALSGPVKRRANVIEMPNLLASIVESSDRKRFREAVAGLIRQSKERLESRKREGNGSVLDSFRAKGFEDALVPGSTFEKSGVLDVLWEICTVCNQATQTSLTLGVLQDVLDYLVLSGDDYFTALDLQLAQKIVPQLTGPARVARELRALLTDLSSPKMVAEQPSAKPSFPGANDAINRLLHTEDPGSGLVFFPY